MIETIKKMFGGGNSANLEQLVKEGAIILDVRTKAEYAGGHVNGSINIPLNTLEGSLKKLDKDKVIITCCASGMRSGSAKSILESHGFTHVHNGGSWTGLRHLSN